MPDTSWINHPTLKNVDKRKIVVLLELINETEGKPLDKCLPILMNANKRLQEQNLTFTKDEYELIFDIISKKMSPKEKMQFEMIKKMMATRK